MNGPHIQLFGNLVRDPERKFTTNNATPYANVRVATNTYRGPDVEPETNFFDVTLWRRHAETAANHCRKGQQVYIAGRFTTREYTRNDGTTATSLHINAKDFRHFPMVQQPQEEVTQAIATQPDTPEPTDEDLEYQLINDEDLPY